MNNLFFITIIIIHLFIQFYVNHLFSFKILTGCRMKWVAASLGHVPEGAIIGGYRHGKPRYYVARVKHEGMIIVGKVSLFYFFL